MLHQKISHTVMGYATVKAYMQRLVRYPLQLICLVLRVNTGQNRCINPKIAYLSYLSSLL